MRISTALLVLAGLGVAACGPRRGDSPRGGADDYLKEDEVSTRSLLPAFQAAYVNAELDPDGDLKLNDDSLRQYVFIRMEKQDRRYSMFAILKLKPGATQLDKLRLVNRLNDQLALVRFSLLKDTKLFAQYQVLVKGGASKRQAVEAYRLFVRVVKGLEKLDMDGILEDKGP